MILQALAEYYGRADLAPPGWEYKRIPFYIEIGTDGAFLQLIDRRFGPKPADVPPTLVPKSEIRSGTHAFERPNALWDHYGFVLGNSKSDADKDRSTAERQIQHFTAKVEQLCKAAPESIELHAIRVFYEREEYKRVTNDPLWRDCGRIAGCNLTFRIAGQIEVAVQAASVRKLFSPATVNHEDTQTARGVCLITGATAPVAKLHYPIANVGEKPAPLCATNKPAYWSFGKEKGFGFPVSADANFRYTTALNHLLRPGSRQRLQVGDASTVFWTHEPDEMEDRFGSIFGGSDDPNHTEELRAALEAIHSGKFDGGRGDNRFFVLGLAPNAARISVRFWHAEPLRAVAQRIREWFEDIEIGRGKSEPQYLSLKRLLTSVCLATKERPYGDIERLPPSIGGDVARAIFSGGELPAALLSAALHRCRAEQAKKDDTGKPVRHVSYARAAIIKAWLNRHCRNYSKNQKETSVSLDKSNTHAPYVLGRLFATFERMQEAAAERELNRTIRDSFFGAAMAAPRSVFSRLVALNQTHLRNLKRSRPSLATNFDKLLLEIVDKLNPQIGFPGSFNLMEQGVFAIGYYHQRHDLFSKSSAPASSQSNATSTSKTEVN